MSDVSVLFIADIDLLDISCCPRKKLRFMKPHKHVGPITIWGIFFLIENWEPSWFQICLSLVACRLSLLICWGSKMQIPHSMIHFHCTVNNRCKWMLFDRHFVAFSINNGVMCKNAAQKVSITALFLSVWSNWNTIVSLFCCIDYGLMPTSSSPYIGSMNDANFSGDDCIVGKQGLIQGATHLIS